MKRLFVLLIVVFALLNISSCYYSYPTRDDDITYVGIYRDTPVWELAKAVNSQNILKIKRILNDNPDIVDYKDPKYETPLVVWAAGMEKYSSLKTLLKCGADPNATSEYVGGTALLLMAQESWIDVFNKQSPRYVKLLIEYGADVNKGYEGSTLDGIDTHFYENSNGEEVAIQENYHDIGRTPLMAAIEYEKKKS